ncbi:MAG: class I SAM-dependent methyltransferase [Rubrivivax sp.]|nr:class I SAM-dependent methyltransferase [Rubrivivax sp.]
MAETRLETIACPYCGSNHHEAWAQELGFVTVRCQQCGLLYCNPRPAAALIDAAVRTGAHGPEAQGLVVTARRIPGKVSRYRRVFTEMFGDLWHRGRPVSWLDVGAGYGEVVEAVKALAPAGSRVVGLEPMGPKAAEARRRGLEIIENYLHPGLDKVQVVSVVDVFSHVPDFGAFLSDVRAVLEPGGELFLETGNLADLDRREEFPYELGLPDHLVFAGERHLLGYLERAGFEVVGIRRWRIDGLLNLAKNIVKKLIGRPAAFGIPYTSRYRQIQVRARLRIQAA